MNSPTLSINNMRHALQTNRHKLERVCNRVTRNMLQKLYQFSPETFCQGGVIILLFQRNKQTPPFPTLFQLWVIFFQIFISSTIGCASSIQGLCIIRDREEPQQPRLSLKFKPIGCFEKFLKRRTTMLRAGLDFQLIFRIEQG